MKTTITYSIDEYFDGRVIAYRHTSIKRNWFESPSVEDHVIYKGDSELAAEKAVTNEVRHWNENTVQHSKSYDSKGNRIISDCLYI